MMLPGPRLGPMLTVAVALATAPSGAREPPIIVPPGPGKPTVNVMTKDRARPELVLLIGKEYVMGLPVEVIAGKLGTLTESLFEPAPVPENPV